VPARRRRAFAPGRVNVIGEHTDYNDGLALPFAIAEGVTVRAESLDSGQQMEAIATDLDERDSFPLAEPGPAEGWRAYVHGAVAELAAAGHPLVPAGLEISGRVPLGSGLSSSAALTVALCLAMLELGFPGAGLDEDRLALARLCSRVESEWAGAQTGLLDQIASLFGAADTAILIDFQSLAVEPVELELGGWRFVVADSGERHVHASSGYNERRRECAAACVELGIESLREANLEDLPRLPEPLEMRVRHVIEENARVLEAVAAVRAGEIGKLARLLNESHASLRDLYQVSTPAVEATVERLLRAGVTGARLMGGGFGGSVLGLLEPGLALPPDTLEVLPGPGARILPR
jgi:galactokinase